LSPFEVTSAYRYLRESIRLEIDNRAKGVPMNENDIPLYSEILPNLWQGGTAETDLVSQARELPRAEEQSFFESVATLTSYANPVGWHVKELRFGFPDAELSITNTQDIEHVADWAYGEWKAGKRVLIRCQAGLNRSGLVMALVLMRDGNRTEQAIETIRKKRSPIALNNVNFLEYLAAKPQ
jgi:hypothetical protein